MGWRVQDRGSSVTSETCLGQGQGRLHSGLSSAAAGPHVWCWYRVESWPHYRAGEAAEGFAGCMARGWMP